MAILLRGQPVARRSALSTGKARQAGGQAQDLGKEVLIHLGGNEDVDPDRGRAGLRLPVAAGHGDLPAFGLLLRQRDGDLQDAVAELRFGLFRIGSIGQWDFTIKAALPSPGTVDAAFAGGLFVPALALDDPRRPG